MYNQFQTNIKHVLINQKPYAIRPGDYLKYKCQEMYTVGLEGGTAGP